MTTLTDFLIARIAEDEAVASAAHVLDRRFPGDGEWRPAGLEDPWPQEEAHVVRFAPARVLAECQAKRQIVELTRNIDPFGEIDWEHVVELDDAQVRVLADVLRRLALPYSDHPHYLEEWRA